MRIGEIRIAIGHHPCIEDEGKSEKKAGDRVVGEYDRGGGCGPVVSGALARRQVVEDASRPRGKLSVFVGWVNRRDIAPGHYTGNYNNYAADF